MFLSAELAALGLQAACHRMAQPVKYQGVDKESSGYKLLAAMGWQEGNGLVWAKLFFDQSAQYCLNSWVPPCLLCRVPDSKGSRST